MSKPRWTIGIFAASGDLEPDLDRSLGAPPAVARLLAGDGDEAEIPDRSAIGLRVPVDHDDPLSPPGGGERMGEAADASADDGEIVRLRRGRHSLNGDLEFNSRRSPRRTPAL